MKSTALWSLAAALACAFSQAPAALAQTPDQNASARVLFIDGRNFWDDGRFVEAEKKFREALARFPKADQADRTTFYLITTLLKQGKVPQARMEIEKFEKTYPKSSWLADVKEKQLGLGLTGVALVKTAPLPPLPMPPVNVQIASPRPVSPESGAWRVYEGSPSFQQEVLRALIEKDADRGIEAARERIKSDPSDPAVVANLKTIATSSSPKALPFLVSLAGTARSPNTRQQAIFWMSRGQADREAVAKALMEMLSGTNDKAMETAVAEAFAAFNTNERKSALDHMMRSASPERQAIAERIYRSSSSFQVRTQIVQSVAPLPEVRTLFFLGEVAKNDKDMVVRRTAVQAIASRKEAEATKILEDLLKTMPVQ